MKLFGGNQDGGHVAKDPAEEPVIPQPPPKEAAPREQPRRPERPEREAWYVVAAGYLRKVGAFFRSERVRRLRVPLMVLGCAVLVVLAALIAHAAFVRPPDRTDEGLNVVPTVRPAVTDHLIATPPPDAVLTETPSETQAQLETETPNLRRESSYTFLLLANDQTGGNTDVILVGRLDTEAGTLDLVNIPRDTLVNVSWGVKKLNTVMRYERGDIERFEEHLTGLIGFSVDSYAILDFAAVEKIVDTMNGVAYYVPRDMDYDDPTQDLHIHITQGSHWLSGAEVVQVMRFREGNNGTGYPNGDIGRIKTQQDLLKAMAEQFLNVRNIPHLDEVIRILTENGKTDLTARNLAFFAEEFLKMDKEDIRFHTAPGTAIAIRGGSYYELELDGWIDMINAALNPFTQDVGESNLDVLRSIGADGALSTNGTVIPLNSFYDYNTHTG